MVASVKCNPLFAVLMLDLSRFAFGTARPDHLLHSESEVRKMIAQLPADPGAGLAELAQWAVSINQTESFTPEHRARVLMAMDVAAHDRWREVCSRQLAPNGTPAEGRDIDSATLRVLLETATAFANSYAQSLANGAMDSGWIKKNLAPVMLRRALWLAHRLALANTLHQPNVASLWEEVHALYRQAQERQVLGTVLRAFPDAPATSIKQEYVRLLLMEIAGQDTLCGREIELAFRIAGRVAASVRLEPERFPEAPYAIVPEGASRPTSAQRLAKSGKALYLDASPCLPHLQAMLNRDPNCNFADVDAFNREFTVRESHKMLHCLIEYWGPNPPKRRAQRVALDAPVKLRCGLDSAFQVVAPLEQGLSLRNAAVAALRAQFERDRQDQRAHTTKATPEARSRLADASAAGLGVRVSRKDAAWARTGALLAICVEPGPDWVVGTLRRISAEGDMLRFGIRVLARRPRLGWFHLESGTRPTACDHEDYPEKNFLERYQRAILLDFDFACGAAGEMLLPNGVVAVGARLDFPLFNCVQNVRVTEIREATKGFDRVAFEVSGSTPYKSGKTQAKQEADGPDPWKFAV